MRRVVPWSFLALFRMRLLVHEIRDVFTELYFAVFLSCSVLRLLYIPDITHFGLFSLEDYMSDCAVLKAFFFSLMNVFPTTNQLICLKSN